MTLQLFFILYHQGQLAFAGTSIIYMAIPSGISLTDDIISNIAYNVRSVVIGATAITCSTCSIDGLTGTISGGSFSYMLSLEYFYVNKNAVVMKSLGYAMFKNSHSLKSVIIPSFISIIR